MPLIQVSVLAGFLFYTLIITDLNCKVIVLWGDLNCEVVILHGDLNCQVAVSLV